MTRTVAGTATGKVAVLSDIHGTAGAPHQPKKTAAHTARSAKAVA